MIDKSTFRPGELYIVGTDGQRRDIKQVEDVKKGDWIFWTDIPLGHEYFDTIGGDSLMDALFPPPHIEFVASSVPKPHRTRKAPPAPRGPSVRAIRSGGAS